MPAELHHNNPSNRESLSSYIGIVLFAAAIYVGCMVSPPWLMDDVDSVQAQISRTMLTSGDWVTAHIDGVSYLEKSPLNYWLVAGVFRMAGVHDWAARIPGVLSAIALGLVTCAFGIWAFGRRAARPGSNGDRCVACAPDRARRPQSDRRRRLAPCPGGDWGVLRRPPIRASLGR